VRTFEKRAPDAPPGFFEAEARGLAWLAEAGSPVPEVVSLGPDHIATAWVEQGPWTPAAVEEAGRAVAAMHRFGAKTFGFDGPGFIGPLPMSNEPAPDWPTFYVERRVLPFLRDAVEHGALPVDGALVIERVCARLDGLSGPPEAPARIHGDLWSGNVLCDADGQPWLVDPAAHGGHRETDLAMLALFGGGPWSERFVAAYVEVNPLADGWRERRPLHQLHPLLVHAVLFGGSYGRAAVDAAERFA
jgi:fructosamine-3-kinase